MKGSRHSAFCLLIILCQGCARLTPSIKTTEAPDVAYAYFYGQLQLKDDSGFYLGSSEIALRLEHEESGHKVSMRYQVKDPITVVRVKPGTYRLRSVLFLDNFNAVFGEKPLQSGGQPWRFTVRPGRAYYVGDSAGSVGWQVIGKRYRWQVHGFSNQFAETTQLFRQRYPLLRPLPVENALIKKGESKQTPVMLAEVNP